MDFLEYPAIRLMNISYELTRSELATKLVSIFRSEYGHFNLTADQITMHRKGNDRFAVINGIMLDFGEIKKILAQKKIDGQNVLVMHDFGFPRYDNGEFLTPLSGWNKQLMAKLFMHPNGNIHRFFIPEIRREIADGTYSNKVTMHNLVKLKKKSMILEAGRVLACKVVKENNNMVVEYYTLLEKLQAICYLNRNEEFAEKGSFKDCQINLQKGLGRRGLLDVAYFEEKYGYIPFEEFNHCLIVKPTPYRKYTKCYKCNQKGTINLVGVTPCLKFFAGKCDECVYSKDNNPLALNAAVVFQRETFSRVLIGRNDLERFEGFSKAFNLVLTPLKLRYNSRKAARQIMCPIVWNDAWTSGKIFTLSNKTKGEVERADFIEVIESSEDVQAVFLLTVRIGRTKVWSPESTQMFHHVTIKFGWSDSFCDTDEFKYDTRKANVMCIEKADENHVRAKFRLSLNLVQNRILPTVDIRPYAPNPEYNALCDVMKRWVEKPAQASEFDILNNVLLGGTSGYDLDPKLFPQKPLHFGKLNEGQADAVRRCQAGRITVVQGPPGTGKTYTAAVAVLEIARTESGLIICTAKSNEAADNLCDAIEKKLAMQPVYTGIRVVRMAAVKKQNDFFRSARRAKGGSGDAAAAAASYDDDATTDVNNYRYLHEEIASHDLFLANPIWQPLIQKIDEHWMDLLTDAETDQLKYHIEAISRQVMSKVNILVTTTAALTDGRIKDFLESSSTKLNTIVMDEAGVVPMPLAMPMFVFPARRFLLFGDQQQLRPFVTSVSAETAGLGMSVMKFIELGIAPKHGDIWKTLHIQYRSNPGICKIVSDMTYSGQLKCGENIAKRSKDDNVIRLERLVREAFPDIEESPNVVVQHKFPDEVNSSKSKFNRKEALIILKIAERLTSVGIDPRMITVITPYDAQRTLLHETLSKNNLTRQIAVVNADSFQGKENEIIILSFVRSNDRGDIGFCRDQNRLNVMISRARQFQFYVGDMQMIMAERTEDTFMKRLREALDKVPRIQITINE